LVAIQPSKLGNAIFTAWPMTPQALHNLFKVLLGKVLGLVGSSVAG
jgi:hypothetical protein